MRPILLKGHERSITSLKFNREGDLIFTASKYPTFVVWYTHNGERLGTYEGHTGAVWSIDVDSKFCALKNHSSLFWSTFRSISQIFQQIQFLNHPRTHTKSYYGRRSKLLILMSNLYSILGQYFQTLGRRTWKRNLKLVTQSTR
jgi:WD40 repeat protein